MAACMNPKAMNALGVLKDGRPLFGDERRWFINHAARCDDCGAHLAEMVVDARELHASRQRALASIEADVNSAKNPLIAAYAERVRNLAPPPDFLDEVIAEGARKNPRFAELVDAELKKRRADRDELDEDIRWR